MRLLLLYFLLFTTIGFSQDFQWARQIKGTGDYDDFANQSDVDTNGNSYILGRTESGLFDIDPTVSGVAIVDNSTIQNFAGTYLIKLDSNGNYMWGKTFGSYKRGDNSYGVKIGTDGNIYILLTLENLNTSQNVIDSFITIIKIAPNGNILSTKTIKQNQGINGGMNVSSFDLDSQNNIFLTGYFTGNITVDASNPNLSLSTNTIDNYLLKIDNNGSFDWIRQFNITTTSGGELTVRPDGNINLILRSSNYSDYNLYNIDNSNHSLIWQKTFINQLEHAFHVSNNGIVILGEKNNFTDIVDVDPSSGVSNITSNSSFIIFLNLNGDFVDVKEFYRPVGGYITFSAVTSDLNNNYVFAGNFLNTVDFNPSSNSFNITSAGAYGESFYLKLDQNRNFDSAIKIGHENPQINPYHNCYGFHIKGLKIVNDYSYLMGDFQWWCDFDPSTTTQYSLGTINSSTVNKDGFMLKLGPCDTNRPNGDSDQYFCSIQNPTIANLSPNSASIKWYNSLSSTNQLSATSALINGQTYYAAKQIGNCPESTDRLAVTVHINQTPIPPLASNQAFCENDHAKISNLTVTGQNLNWYDSQTGGNLLATSTILQNNTTYYVSQTVNNCESNRTPISITIKPSTIPTLNSPQNFCIQQNATLNTIAITGQNIQWYDALTNGNALANTTILQNGMTYYASQTSNSCESLRVPVTVNVQNTSAPTGSDQSFCATQNPTLSDVIVSGTNINWYSSAVSTSVLSTTTALVNGTTYYATQTLNGCESINRLPITVTLINTLNATDYAETLCDDLNDGNENINLTAYNPNLISNTSGCTFEYYNSLQGATNQIGNDQITNANGYSLGLGLKTIYVRITSSNGCHQIVELQLTLVSKPIINISNIMPICEGNSITVNAGTGYDSYLWSTGESTSSITISHPDNYSVTVSENHGTVPCYSTKNFSVVKSNMATISEVISSDWTNNENTVTVLLTGSSVGLYEYSLDGIHYQNSNTFSGLENGEYIVFVKDKNGCGIRPESFYLLMYPKFFTPNGDGFNDTWKIKFSKNEPNLTVKLFDRFGKLLKAIDNKTGWDGTLNNQELPATDYWFIVTRQNGKEHRGHFALKR